MEHAVGCQEDLASSADLQPCSTSLVADVFQPLNWGRQNAGSGARADGSNNRQPRLLLLQPAKSHRSHLPEEAATTHPAEPTNGEERR